MPSYEFICPEDGTVNVAKMTLEEYSKESEGSGHYVCPECGGEMRRKFSPPAISIK